MSNTETVRALVDAFNVNNYDFNAVKTNFKLQSRDGKDCIVVSFDKGMEDYQCSEYLYNIKRKIVGEFYGIEEGDTDEVVLNTAKLIFDVKSFPFNNYKGDWSDKQGRIEFVAPIDEGVIFNLKSHLASSLKKDVLEDMPTFRIVTKASNKKNYLWHGKFPNKELCKEFEREFLSRMENRYGYRNVFKNPLKIEGNSVYIKDVFDDARFIDSVTRHVAWLIGRDLQADSKSRSDVRAFKDLIMEILDPSTRVVTSAFLCASPLNREEASILIPVILSNRGARFLTTEEAGDINHKFSNPVLDDISDKIQAILKVNGDSAIYGIDFSNKEISHCVVTKIIESSVINKDHELSIDPGLSLQALSHPSTPVHNGYLSSDEEPGPSSKVSQAQLRSPTGKSQDGTLKEPPRQGFIGAHSALLVSKQVDVLGTSGGSLPSSKLGSIAVSYDVAGPSSSQSVNAAEYVPARTSVNSSSSQGTFTLLSGSSSSKGAQANAYQPITDWSLPAFPGHIPGNVVVRPSLPSSLGTSGNERPDSAEQSEPIDLSRKGAAQNVPAAQPKGRWSFSPPSPPPFIPKGPASSPPPLIPSSSNVSGSQPPVSFTSTLGPGSSPPPLIPSSDSFPRLQPPVSFTSTLGPGSSPPPLIPSSSNVSGSQPPAQMSSSGPSSSKGAQAGANIGKEEEKLIEALLYTLNLTNYTNDGVYTNFFAKDGKIVSLLHDNVEREEYLQAVIKYIIEEYYETEEEARKSCDFYEFPFKFLPDPDYEKNQNDYEPKKTVVANISSGALSNLKILFSQKFGKNVDAIGISAVKKVEKREKDEWVDRQRSYGASLKKACESCFPDEEAIKKISIAFAFEEGEYVLNRSRDPCEVRLLLREQSQRFRPLTKEEKELFEALLYAFNYSNHNFDRPGTNFTVKNGKIASLIGDSVNVKEYLQEVRDKTKEEYCKDKKEAYDFNDFPFKFLSNCEKNQKMTVVANISRSALLNLKKLFIYGYGEREDINTKTVEEAVKSKKDGLVDLKLKGIEREGGYLSRIKPDEAVTESYPDKSALERLSIEKYGAGYCLNRDYKPWETQEYAQGRSEAKRKKEKMKPDNKDSGISSGEATDAENVSSKAEGETSGTSGYESMDCDTKDFDRENTERELLEHRSPCSEDEDSLSESSISGSSSSSSKSDGGNTGGGSPKRPSEGPCSFSKK